MVHVEYHSWRRALASPGNQTLRAYGLFVKFARVSVAAWTMVSLVTTNGLYFVLFSADTIWPDDGEQPDESQKMMPSQESNMKNDLKFAAILVTLALGFAVPAFSSSVIGTADNTAKITGINSDGVVTATDNKGRAFKFRVTSPEVLQALRSGQTVMIDPATGQVSVPGVDKCCELVKPTLKRKR